MLDLAEAPGQKMLLPAPLSPSYRLQLVNRAPGAKYTVNVGNSQFTIYPVEAKDFPPGILARDDDGTLNCATLQRFPLGKLCRQDSASGAPQCAGHEAGIRKEVEEIRKALRECKDLRGPVEQWLTKVTTWSPTQPFSAPAGDWEEAVTVSRQGAIPVWAATISTCAPESQLEAYLKTNYPAEPLMVLAFDHQSQTWTGRHWDTHQLHPIAEIDLENSFTNKPRLFLKKGDQLAVFATNTNPLLFSTAATAATEANREDIANLQKFTGLLGSFLAAPFVALGDRERADVASTEAGLKTTEAQNDLILSMAYIEKATPPPPTVDPLQTESAKLLQALQSPAGTLTTAIQGVQKESKELDRSLQAVKETNAELKTYLQLVESDSPVGIEPRSFPADFRRKLATIDGSFARVGTARAGLEMVEDRILCAQQISSLRDAVQLARLPLPEKAPERKQAMDRFLDVKETLLPGQTDAGCPAPEAKRIGEIARLLPSPSTSGPPADQDEILRILFKGLDAYTTLVEQRKTTLKTTGDLLASRGDIAKTVGGLQIALERRASQPQSSSGCSLRSGVLQVSRVEGLDAKLRFTKVRSEGFKIALDSNYKDSVALRHPAEASATYELARATKWDFDVDVALIYTRISDPVFSAVKRSTATGDKLFVERTDEKTRSGELAMFLGRQWRKNRGNFFSFGPQIGVGVSTDKPAIFGGVGFGLGPYIKLSAGWSWQRVKALQRGQTESVTIVDSKDDIRTRDVFDNGFYASLAVTVDDLPFFKAPEK